MFHFSLPALAPSSLTRSSVLFLKSHDPFCRSYSSSSSLSKCDGSYYKHSSSSFCEELAARSTQGLIGACWHGEETTVDSLDHVGKTKTVAQECSSIAPVVDAAAVDEQKEEQLLTVLLYLPQGAGRRDAGAQTPRA